MQQLLYEIREQDNLIKALKDIKKNADSIDTSSILLHIYCGSFCCSTVSDRSSMIMWMVEKAKEILPQAQIFGFSSEGEICKGNITKTSCTLLSVFLFNSSWVKTFSFKGLYSHEQEAVTSLTEELERYPDLKGVEMVLARDDINSAPIYKVLTGCPDKLPFFGGYAAKHYSCNEPAFIITEEGLLTNAMAAVLYGGKDLHIDTGRTTGWKSLGRPFRVTKAEGRRLYTVDGIPAYELYNQFLKIPEEKSFRDYAMEFPLIIRKGKMHILRHPQKKYEDSSILLDGPVEEGKEIRISCGAPMEIIRKINIRCEKLRDFEPEALLLYSCKGRRAYWGDLIDWEMEPFQKIAESSGACLEGQIMRNFVSGRVLEHRLTLLSVAMREGPKTGRYIPDIEVDDAILKGRMSLVHRMSTLIESMVSELQKTNDMLFGMNERLARANDELRRIAVTDELTGLYNRREIERRIKESLEHTSTDNSAITLIMLDIDFFKKVNDNYGHDVGDLVLKEVSTILKKCTDESQGEAVGRWGGEEFFILLPDKNLAEAMDFAEHIRKAVENHDFPEVGHLTISLGVASANANSNYQAIFIEIDQALYQAKQNGRNQVVGSDPLSENLRS